MPDDRPHAEPGRVRAMLERANGQTDQVDVRETHISWVFLVGQRAYKLKKPLVLPFLDYGTPARRRLMCQEELRLNRRLAPDLYLRVWGLAAAGEELELVDEQDPRALDYVVEMRRYDEASTLAAVLADGGPARADIDAVARRLAEFHAGCETAPAPPDPALAVRREIDDNIIEILPLLGHAAGVREQVLALWRAQSAFIAAHARILDARAREGLVREGHGDLRAEHVLLGDPPEVVDCVEFDPALRTLDIADDLAFLLMDLTALGGRRWADELAAAYRRAGGDPGDDSLLAFYACHRALVRFKVVLVRNAQQELTGTLVDHSTAHASDLLEVAERFAWRARAPVLVVVCGVPASGKSHLAAALARASGVAHISSDLTRKRLAGVDPGESAPLERYSDEYSQATYGELGRLARAEVAARGGAFVDATFRRRVDRQAFAETFAEAAPVVFVQCEAPLGVLAERARQRQSGEGHGSDATVAVVLHERERWEPLDEVPAPDHLIIRSDQPLEALVAELVDFLDRRRASSPTDRLDR